MEPPIPMLRCAPRSRGPRAFALRVGLSGAVASLVLLVACGEPDLRPSPPERFRILPDMPKARHDPERLDVGEGVTPEIRPSRPRLCEAFDFPTKAGAIDVLVVPDLGRSMTGTGLRATYQSLLDALFLNPRLSFRIGIVPADSTGRFVPIAGTPLPYVTCAPDATVPCTIGDWETARAAILDAMLAVEPTPASLGLLAVVRALDGEMGARFLREDAELHVVLVSDADDASCAPRSGGAVACTSFDACGCGAELDAGDVDWFVRHLRNAKGHGFEERVRVSAWVATASDPLTTEEGTGVFVGCAVDADVGPCRTPWSEGEDCALHAPRYAAVVRALGGSLHDLCSEPDGLTRIGAFAAGVAPEFALERKPLSTTIETVLLSFPEKSCNHRDSCLEEGLDCIRGRCGMAVSEGGADGWQYVTCSSGIPTSKVRFEDPDRLRNRKIEICYDVDVGADPFPCH